MYDALGSEPLLRTVKVPEYEQHITLPLSLSDWPPQLYADSVTRMRQWLALPISEIILLGPDQLDPESTPQLALTLMESSLRGVTDLAASTTRRLNQANARFDSSGVARGIGRFVKAI